MKLLLVENDANFLSVLTEALEAIHGLSFEIARSRDSALALVGHAEFDLIVCDLGIPTQDGALDENKEHGLAVCVTAGSVVPGTPVLILSAFGTIDLLTQLLRSQRLNDIFGNGREYKMLEFVQKANLPEFVKRVETFGQQVAELDQTEISNSPPTLVLTNREKRILKIFGRRHQGAIVQVSEIGGGLSRSRTFRLRVLDQNSAVKSLALGKLGALDDVKLESERYQKHVAPCLGVGAFTTLMDQVTGGAGSSGGIFYTLAFEYEDSLFDVLMKDPDRGANVVRNGLRQLLKRWWDGAFSRSLTVGDIRRELLADKAVLEASPALRGISWSRFEEQKLQIRACCQHRDLHGLNVLVAGDRPVLIDYGEVDIAAASLDPITLELSLIFHPGGKSVKGDWPPIAQAEKWYNLEIYVQDCPVAEFVRACREWALEAKIGNRELYANAYAYCARQLKYPDTDHSLAGAIIKRTIKAFEVI